MFVDSRAARSLAFAAIGCALVASLLAATALASTGERPMFSRAALANFTADPVSS